MNAVPHNPRAPNIRPEYGDFLYATISDDGTSVLSAIARMNRDPWEEAVTLADLPSKSATSRLAALIAAMPGIAPDQPGLIAARLVKLLPHQSRLPQASHFRAPQPSRLRLLLDQFKVPGRRGTPSNEVARPRFALHIVLLLIVLALTAEWYIASRPHAPSPATTKTQPSTAR